APGRDRLLEIDLEVDATVGTEALEVERSIVARERRPAADPGRAHELDRLAPGDQSLRDLAFDAQPELHDLERIVDADLVGPARARIRRWFGGRLARGRAAADGVEEERGGDQQRAHGRSPTA